MKKPFNETKFGGFLNKIVKGAGHVMPEIAEIVQTALTNPLGALYKTGELLLKKKDENTDNPEILALQKEFELQQHEFEMELLNWKLDAFKAENEDRQRATNMYQFAKDMTDKIAERIMKMNIWYVIGLFVSNILVVMFANKLGINDVLLGTISNFLGIIIGSLFAERRTVVEYYMGASIKHEKK